MKKSWSHEKILSEIKDRLTNKKSLTYVAVRDENNALLAAATSYFGSWREAVKEAGLKPEYVHKYITKDDVISELKRLPKDQLKPINFRNQNSGLLVAAKKKFGSWQKAIVAAGIDISETPYQHKIKWTKENIISKIKEYHENGLDINSAAVHKRKSTFYEHTIQIFGTWDNALRDAGFDPLKVRKNGFWTPQRVVDEIKLRVKDGKKINVRSVGQTSLYQQAYKFFGSWRKAVKAAGEKITANNSYFGEHVLHKVLQSFWRDVEIERNKTFDWLKTGLTKRSYLHLDFYCDKYKVAFELQGPAHFFPVHGVKTLKLQQKRDRIKKHKCVENNICLIPVRYSKLTCAYVSERLTRFNIPHQFSDQYEYLCEKYAAQYTNKLQKYCHTLNSHV